MHVVAHPAAEAIGRRLSELLEAELIVAETKRFPDGEVYARLPPEAVANLSPQPVVVTSTRPNEHLLESMFLTDAVWCSGGEDPTVVVPYMAYARQDRVFTDGEGVSAEVVAGAMGRDAGRVVCLDVHALGVLEMFGVPTFHATAVPDLAHHLADEGVSMVLAPDEGARERAETAAGVLDLPWDHLEKTRLSGTDVSIAPKDLDVGGHTIAIVDDIVSSGGTMATAASQLREQGADRVVVAATHGLFVGDAVERLEKAGVDTIVTTDSVPGPHSRVSCADAIARQLREE